MRARHLLVGTLFVLACACVTPARTFDAYQGKATSTAETVQQAVGTARLGFEAAARSKAFRPYLDVLISKAETDADSATGVFDSIEPPDPRSDSLHDRLDKILQDATTTLRDLRIAARRGELAKANDESSELKALAEKLNAFVEAHQ